MQFSPVVYLDHTPEIQLPEGGEVWEEQVPASGLHRTYTLRPQPFTPPAVQQPAPPPENYTAAAPASLLLTFDDSPHHHHHHQPPARRTGVSLLSFSSRGHFLATREDGHPTTVWIWEVAGPQALRPRAVLVQHAEVKGLLWHPVVPDLLLVECGGMNASGNDGSSGGAGGAGGGAASGAGYGGRPSSSTTATSERLHSGLDPRAGARQHQRTNEQHNHHPPREHEEAAVVATVLYLWSDRSPVPALIQIPMPPALLSKRLDVSWLGDGGGGGGGGAVPASQSSLVPSSASSTPPSSPPRLVVAGARGSVVLQIDGVPGVSVGVSEDMGANGDVGANGAVGVNIDGTRAASSRSSFGAAAAANGRAVDGHEHEHEHDDGDESFF